MAVSVYNIFMHAVEMIFYTFHLSMLLLLCVNRKTTFKGPFYNVFRIVLFADMACFASYMLSLRVPQAGIAIEFYKQNGFLASIFYHISSYFILVQFLGHLLMALNRFTLLWFPFQHQYFWKSHWYYFSLIGLPFLNVCYRLHEPGAFVFTANNTVVVTLVDSNLMSLTFVISAVIYVSSTCIEAILNLLSLMKFSSATNNKNEKDLLLVSCIIFVAQLFRTCYTVGRPMFTGNEEMTVFLIALLPIMNIVFAGAGSVSLLMLSPTTRKEYKNFFFCGGLLSAGATISSHPVMISGGNNISSK